MILQLKLCEPLDLPLIKKERKIRICLMEPTIVFSGWLDMSWNFGGKL
jgi:hypothetical protein